jgi:hypothetical protein
MTVPSVYRQLKILEEKVIHADIWMAPKLVGIRAEGGARGVARAAMKATRTRFLV